MGIWYSKHSIRVCQVGAVLLASAAMPGFAGIFNKTQPVPQWGLDAYKTKTPGYAKDAAAVVLYHEYVDTVDAQGRAVERERKVIRILKPQGRDNLCYVSHDIDEKINYFRAWTIAADEKQYQAQETDFFEVGSTENSVMLSTTKTRVVKPPAVDVNAVLICESEELLAPYQEENLWEIQDDVPIVDEALEVDLPPGRTYSTAWHQYKGPAVAEVAPNRFRWEIHDMHALDLRGVPAHPAWRALAARMTVHWGEAAVEGKDKQWQALGRRYTSLQEHRPDPSPEITAQTQGLVAGASDYYTKLVRITDYIQKNIRYFVVERGIGGWQAHPATDIFRNRYGDCKDKTILLISMLQVAGIHAYYVPVDTHRDFVDPEMPSFYGNHMITAIEVPADVHDDRLKAIVQGKNGKRYLIFDPTNERTPVGSLPSYEQGSYGLLAAGDASQVIELPVLAPEASGADRKGEFKLAADGGLSGTVETVRIGTEGGETRQGLKDYDQKQLHDNLEQSLGLDIPGVSLVKFKYDEPPALDKPVTLHYELSAQQYARQAGPLLLVRPRVVGSDVIPNDDKPRTVPIEMNATGRWHDSYDIALPDGYVVDEMPDPVNLDMEFASYHSTVSAPEAGKGKVLHYEREYKVKNVELPAEKAAEFHKLEGTILADEKATVVLKKAPASGAAVASGSTPQ